jgi:hypothetical protein
MVALANVTISERTGVTGNNDHNNNNNNKNQNNKK